MWAPTWWVFEIIGGILVAGFLVGIYYWYWPRADRRIWKCVRYQGGGSVVTPRSMTIEEATRWLGRDNNGEVMHVDRDRGFIFYRPRGG